MTETIKAMKKMMLELDGIIDVEIKEIKTIKFITKVKELTDKLESKIYGREYMMMNKFDTDMIDFQIVELKKTESEAKK